MNLVASAIGFALNILVGVLFTPYLIRHLGMSAYGLIPLTATITSYLAVATLSINGAVGRFVTAALERDETEEANRYFNTSLFASLGLVVVLLVPGAWIANAPGRFLRLPAGMEADARVLMACIVAVVLLSVVSAPFEVASFCKARFDLRNAVTASGIALRVAAVVVLFSVRAPNVAGVGFAYALSAAFMVAASIVTWRALTPELAVRARHFSKAALATLASAGGWLTVNQVGTLLLVSIDLLVVNRMFGPEHTGRYASLLQWQVLLRGIALTLAGVLSPEMIALYARGDLAGLVAYSRRSVKLLGLAMALPVGLIAGLGEPLLSVWLGRSFGALAPLLAVMVLPLSVNLSCVPLNHVATATNHFRVPGISQVVAGGVNLALALALGRWFGPPGVAAAGGIVLALRNVAFTPWYAASLLDKPWTTFLRDVWAPLLAGAGVFAVSRCGAALLPLASVIRLVVFGGAVCAAYCAAVWKFGLSGEERRLVGRALPGIPLPGRSRAGR